MRLPFVAGALFCLASAASAQVYPYRVVDLDSNTAFSNAWGVSDDGARAAGIRTATGFTWLDGSGFTMLLTLPGYTQSAAFALDAFGNACGVAGAIGSATEPAHAIRFNTDGTLTDLGALGGASAAAYEMNRAGDIVGDAATAGAQWHAFFWQDGAGMTDLLPGATESHGSDVNERDEVTGFTGSLASLAVNHAFRWSATAGFTDLGVPSGYKNSRGFGINAAGQVCGTAQNTTGTIQAWVRNTPGVGWQYVLTNAGPANTAWKINDFGEIVGDTGNLARATMYVDGIGVLDVNTLIPPSSGISLRSAHDINENGQIVGWGFVGGVMHGYRLDPNYMVVHGAGCPGSAGRVPELGGFGPTSAGQTSLMMAEGKASGTGLLFVSMSAGSVPLGLCTYQLGAPLGNPIVFAFDANRQARFTGTMPAGLPSGLSVWFQFASVDPGAPNGGFSLSNALELIVP